ncbi:MAG: tyrosine-protein phosphatase, partial [Clostridia bacterium]|nr:tyrosine-protein phosphatase [Clostridia bacterium]
MHVKKLKLKKLSNTRDLGGLPTVDGKSIKYGKLIRSEKLYNLPQQTKEALESFNITKVLDLRYPTEKEQCPDTMLEGSEYYFLPLLCTATPGITHEQTMRVTMEKESRRIKEEFGSADNYMIAMYRMMLTAEEPVQILKQVMRHIIDAEGCVLWHCSGGKDRAGMVAMIVEGLLGVDDDIIITDYVASHRFQRKKYFWSRLGLVIAPLRRHFKSILYALMAAKAK